jgi:Cof subfamily protein (haloacid dehalogenase superfamily)
MGRGIQVIFCTGRAIECSRQFYDAIGTTGPMVFFNGAVVADILGNNMSGVKIVYSNLLNLEAVDYGIDLARSKDIHYQIYLPRQDGQWEKLLIEKQGPEAEMYQNHTGIIPVVTDLKAAIAAPGLNGVIKSMFITDPSFHDIIRQKMLERFGEKIYIVRSYITFLEILNAGVSKGEGLKTVMRCRGLKPEEVIAFGDEDNDLPMFKAAGFSAAPSNGKDAVRDAADFIYGPSTEEGFAVFVEELFRCR